MSAAVAVARMGARVREGRVRSPCPFCGEFLSVPRRYNAVTYCPKARRMATGLPPRLARFNLADGHRAAEVPQKAVRELLQKADARPRPGILARLREAWRSAIAAWRSFR